MDEYRLKKLVNVKTVTKDIPVAIINGQITQTQQVDTVVLTCPSCGNIIQAFKDGLDIADVNKALVTEELQNELYKVAKYCPQCGQALSYDRSVIEVKPDQQETN